MPSNTINRETTLNPLEDAGCSNDGIRLVRFLLSNINITIKVNKSLSVVFQSAQGGPQGYTLSGLVFTLTLAGALYRLHSVLLQVDRHLLLDILMACLKKVNILMTLISWTKTLILSELFYQ